MIRPAELSDFESIRQIREDLALDMDQLRDNNYRDHIQHAGFLLPLGLDQSDFQNDLHRYTVAEDNGEVVGYMRIDDKQELSPADKVTWLKPEIRDAYFALPHADIGGVGVRQDVGRKGYATELLLAAEQRARSANIPYLFSFVVCAPIQNIPSIKFHEKHGFERLATFEPGSAYGFDNYQSILFSKRLLRPTH